MRRDRLRAWIRVAALLAPAITPLLTVAARPLAAEIPYFARRYRVACTQCHVAPPKLNAFGEAFIANGYAMPELRARGTWPFAFWVSGRSESRPQGAGEDDVRAYLNRIELISGGRVVAPWLSYFVEWRPLSKEGRSDGTLRDRSGRFEDLFVTATAGQLDLTAGQFRQIAQVDVSRRLGVSEPLVLSTSLPGAGVGSPREVSLRAFAPAGRSPSVRLGWTRPVRGEARWSTSLAVPFPGEFSIPLGSEARIEASNELQDGPKGVVVESFVRRGLTSAGAHLFVDADRYLAHAVATGARGELHVTAVGGVARSQGVSRGRWSVEGEYFPRRLGGHLGVGGRAEDQGGDALEPAFIPYLNAHFPGTQYTLRLTVERRIQRGRGATFVEVATVF